MAAKHGGDSYELVRFPHLPQPFAPTNGCAGPQYRISLLTCYVFLEQRDQRKLCVSARNYGDMRLALDR